MTTSKATISFDEIIEADRKRRRNEELANEIFGRSNKQQNDDSNRNTSTRRPYQSPSLASRVGVTKRSSSSTNIKTQKSNSLNPPSRPTSAAAQIARTNRIASAVNDAQQVNVVDTPKPRAALPGRGLIIRGTAGPFIVEASNFAPGTTAADIESALQSVAADSSGVSGLTSCRITSISPTVIAEMVFAERHIADTVIATFNNQKADGRILNVYLKRSGPGSASHLQSRKSEPVFTTAEPNPIAPANQEVFDTGNGGGEMEDVEMLTEAADPYDNIREAENKGRRDREHRPHAEPDVQDGRYGFGGNSHHNVRNVPESPEQQEQQQQQQPLSQPHEDRDGGAGVSSITNKSSSRRDDDRERDRDRRYDDGRYDRRDDRGSSYRRDERQDGYDNRNSRNSRTSHFGNGIRSRGYAGGGFGGSDHHNYGGRMYSDEMMRGGGGGSRGGVPRGGYRNYR